MSVCVFVSAEEILQAKLVVRGEEHHYLAKVRRVHSGQTIGVMDGQGMRGVALVLEIRNHETTIEISSVERVARPLLQIDMALAYIKGERMEWSIAKLVELGVRKIHPFISEHCVVKMDKSRWQKKRERLQAICKAAARQSENPYPSQIAELTDFSSVTELQSDLRIIPTLHSQCKVFPSKEDGVQSALACIGPEGGFSTAEVALALERGFIPATLGPRILRAETASIVCATLLQARFGQFSSFLPETN